MGAPGASTTGYTGNNLGDVNGDGVQDLAVLKSSGGFTVALGDGKGRICFFLHGNCAEQLYAQWLQLQWRCRRSREQLRGWRRGRGRQSGSRFCRQRPHRDKHRGRGSDFLSIPGVFCSDQQRQWNISDAGALRVPAGSPSSSGFDNTLVVTDCRLRISTKITTPT